MVTQEPGRIAIEVWPDGTRYRFDRCEYDERTDRLRLSFGGPTATTLEMTPEGHFLRIAVPDPVLVGLVITDVRHRLARDGRINITFGPLELATLTAADVAQLLTRPVARRTNRFARAVPVEHA